MLVVSLCQTGVKCRYNGTASHKPALMAEIGDDYIALCPELLAGFQTGRPPCEICGGSGEDVLAGTARILTKEGVDVTEPLIEGARKALEICLRGGVRTARLQARSPSCGCGRIYDGTFSSTLRPGNGVFTALLLQNGIEVIEEA